MTKWESGALFTGYCSVGGDGDAQPNGASRISGDDYSSLPHFPPSRAHQIQTNRLHSILDARIPSNWT